MINLTIERLKELLTYEPATGEFRWIAKRGKRQQCGEIAGHIDRSGYRQIRVDQRLYLAHRLAWFYVHGEWPPNGLDHINRAPGDDRIVNLRLATQAENLRNTSIRSDNTSGQRGVSWGHGKWVAEIQVNRKRIYLGRFAELDQAKAAYEAASHLHFGEFATR